MSAELRSHHYILTRAKPRTSVEDVARVVAQRCALNQGPDLRTIVLVRVSGPSDIRSDPVLSRPASCLEHRESRPRCLYGHDRPVRTPATGIADLNREQVAVR